MRGREDIAKRMIASRRLKRKCTHCNREFAKGDVYYRHREVFEEYGEVFAVESLECARCKYVWKEHSDRFKEFKKRCEHPEEFMEDVWDYIPGEAVMQPDHNECRLCGTWF